MKTHPVQATVFAFLGIFPVQYHSLPQNCIKWHSINFDKLTRGVKVVIALSEQIQDSVLPYDFIMAVYFNEERDADQVIKRCLPDSIVSRPIRCITRDRYWKKLTDKPPKPFYLFTPFQSSYDFPAGSNLPIIHYQHKFKFRTFDVGWAVKTSFLENLQKKELLYLQAKKPQTEMEWSYIEGVLDPLEFIRVSTKGKYLFHWDINTPSVRMYPGDISADVVRTYQRFIPENSLHHTAIQICDMEFTNQMVWLSLGYDKIRIPSEAYPAFLRHLNTKGFDVDDCRYARMNHLHLSDSIHMDDISMTFNGQTSIEIISENLHGNPVLFDLSDDDAWELGYFILHTHSIVIDTMGYQEQYKFIPLKASSTEKSLIDSRSYYLWSTLTGTFRYFLGP